MKIEPTLIENAARDLYIRALKILPDDIKQGFDGLAAKETVGLAKGVLGTMIRNIAVAEQTDNLLCQDTGIPIYNVTIGTDAEVDGNALKAAIRFEHEADGHISGLVFEQNGQELKAPHIRD